MKRWNPSWYPLSPSKYYTKGIIKLGLLDTRVDEFLRDYAVDPLHDAWFAVRAVVAPYNILRIPSLPRTYADPDEYLLHAAFQVLKNFIEHEDPFNFIDFSTNELDRWVEKELRLLYHWWTVTRPNRRDAYPGDFHGRMYVEGDGKTGLLPIEGTSRFRAATRTEKYNSYLGECRQEEERQRREDDEMLQRLINIRSHLWT